MTRQLSMPRFLRALPVALVLLVTAIGFAQGKPKASYALPVIDEIHRESYKDFKKYASERQWSRAFRSIAPQIESPPGGLMPNDEGFAMSWREQLFRDLVALGPDARRAFRLFNDAKAAKLLQAAREEGVTPSDRLTQLRHLFYSYFLSSVGDDAAFDLALLELELGQAVNATRRLEALIEHHPDTNLEIAQVWALLTLALSRSGPKEAFADAVAYAKDRFEGEPITLLGFDGDCDDFVAKLEAPTVSAATSSFPDHPRLNLPSELTAAWTQKLDKPSMKRNRRAVFFSDGQSREPAPDAPAFVALDGHLLINHGGQIIRINTVDGKQVWETGKNPQFVTGMGVGRYDIVLAGQRILATEGPSGASNAFQLRALSADGGDRLWSSKDHDGLKEYNFLTAPAHDAKRGYAVVTKGSSFQLFAVAFRLEDGIVDWEILLGTPVQTGSGNAFSPATDTNLSPVVALKNDMLFVMSDGGSLLAVDVQRGQIAWAFQYDYDPRRGSETSPASIAFEGDLVLFRSARCKYLYAIDPARQTVAWQRRTDPTGRFVGMDEKNYYLLGSELTTLSRKDRSLVWSRKLPLSGGRPDLVSSENHLYILTRRGLLELRKDNGDDERIWRPSEILPGGGTLASIGDHLLCIASDRVTALAMSQPTKEPNELPKAP